MIDHDRLFKELLSTFFIEFLQLFVPDVAKTIDPDSVEFLPQKYFADLTTGENKAIDLLAQVRLAGRSVGFLLHVEAQSSSAADFSRRMLFYFARLHQKYLQKIYPVVVFSFDEPQREEPHQYTVEFDDLKVLEFNFRSIQLNRLNWRDYLDQANPVAAALMSKMRIAVGDRPKVKAECLRLLVTLRLNPARTRLISQFVDTYLRLNPAEQQVFQAEVDTMEPTSQVEIMQITTSWMEQGIEQGLKQGLEQGIEQGQRKATRSLILRQLARRVGELPESIATQLEALTLTQMESLGEALLDFTDRSDLERWLAEQA
jgi:Domain of unknown function (DUF4351)/Putative transposase, YhgA-like